LSGRYWVKPVGCRSIRFKEAIDFGPRGGNVHGPNEYADVTSLKLLPKLYTEVAMNLLKN